MALASSDQFALYRYQDATNYRTSLDDITTFVQATTASTLQEVTDNDNETTNALVVIKTDSAVDALVVKLVDTVSFTVDGGGDVSFTGDLLVNSQSSITKAGLITALVSSSTGADAVQLWKSDVGGTGTTVGTFNCQGDLTISGSFIGDGSQLDNITQDLQAVCTKGSTTTTGAEFGGNIGINKPTPDKALDVVGDTRLTGTLLTTGWISCNSLTSQGNVTIGGGDTAGTAGILIQSAGTINVTNDAANQIFVGRTSGSSLVTSQITGAGAAIFNTSVQVTGSPISGAAAGVVISGAEGVTSGSATGADKVWRGFTVGTATETSSISAAGSAKFAGEVSTNRINDNDNAFVAQKAGVDTAVIKTEGSATFAGDGSFGGDGDFTGTLSAGTIANTVPLSAWTDIPLLT